MTHKNIARALYSQITVGRNNALPRPSDKTIDCELRRIIREETLNGRIIINTGNGYFEPDLNDEDDLQALEAYISRKRAGIETQQRIIKKLENALGGNNGN